MMKLVLIAAAAGAVIYLATRSKSPPSKAPAAPAKFPTNKPPGASSGGSTFTGPTTDTTDYGAQSDFNNYWTDGGQSGLAGPGDD